MWDGRGWKGMEGMEPAVTKKVGLWWHNNTFPIRIEARLMVRLMVRLVFSSL